MRTVAQWWEMFDAMVVPKDAHPIQRSEMKRAFYAGFTSALRAGIHMADESGDDDDAGAAMMENLHVECQRFAAEVLNGQA